MEMCSDDSSACVVFWEKFLHVNCCLFARSYLHKKEEMGGTRRKNCPDVEVSALYYSESLCFHSGDFWIFFVLFTSIYTTKFLIRCY
jgi:hypothetical protein